MMNELTVVLTAGFVLVFLVELAADLLSLRRVRAPLPADLEGIHPTADYRRMRAHARRSIRLGLIESAVCLVVFLVFWLGGGMGWLAGVCRGTGWPPTVYGLVFAGALWLGDHLLRLPFSIYDTFVIEQRFGFNRTTPGLYVADEIRGILLVAILGGGMFALLTVLFARGGAWGWAAAWAAVSVVSVLLARYGPTLILPLFNTFRPVPDGPLRERIRALARANDFPVDEIHEMDGSRRSTRANAFFTGLGRRKRVVLFDTLLERHSEDELLAVLAHEIGHYKRGHIVQRMAIGIGVTGAALWVVSRLIAWEPLFVAFGVDGAGVPVGLVLAGIALKPVSWVIGLATSALSRRHEFEADAFAAEATGDPSWLRDALVTLSRDNLSNLNPHPLEVAVRHSHPPLRDRLARLAA